MLRGIVAQRGARVTPTENHVEAQACTLLAFSDSYSNIVQTVSVAQREVRVTPAERPSTDVP